MPHYLTGLQRVIRQLHGCESVHQQSVLVIEKFEGKTLWDGTVEIYRLLAHPKTKLVYAWAYVDDANKVQFVTVLHLHPIDSPQRAVKAHIAARLQAALPGASGRSLSDKTPSSSG